MDYFSSILKETNKEVSAFYSMAKTAPSRPEMLYASGGAAGNSMLDLAGHKQNDRYGHYKSWPYVAIRAISHRIAGQQVFIARRKDDTKKARRQFLSKQVGDVKLEPIKSYEFDRMPSWIKMHMKAGERLENHELLTAISRPNSVMTQWSLMVCTVASIELTGRAFWYVTRDAEDDHMQIWPLPSNWVTPKEHNGKWEEYKIQPAGSGDSYTLPADQVAFFSLPDPANPMGSFSPVEAQIKAIETDEAIQQAQDVMFKRGIFPNLLLRAGRLPAVNGQAGMRPVLTADQRKQLFNAVFSAYEGVANYGEPLIVDGLIEGVEKFTSNPAEMDFMQSGKITKSRILQAFGVNPIILGEVENANRAQAAVAEENFCNNVVNPMIELMSQVMTCYLSPMIDDGNTVIWIDPTHPKDREQKLKEWQEGVKLGAVSINEYRTQILNLPPVEEGDVALRPLNMDIVEHERARKSYDAFSERQKKTLGDVLREGLN